MIKAEKAQKRLLLHKLTFLKIIWKMGTMAGSSKTMEKEKASGTK